MDKENRTAYLNLLLNIILIILVLPFMGIVYLPFADGLDMNIILQYFLGLIFYSTYLLAILNLKKVLKLIAARDPFNSKATAYFKRIGYYILAGGILYGVISYPAVDANFAIFATSYGSLKPAFFIHIILGLLSFIIGDVFVMAKEIKDENDLTI